MLADAPPSLDVVHGGEVVAAALRRTDDVAVEEHHRHARGVEDREDPAVDRLGVPYQLDRLEDYAVHAGLDELLRRGADPVDAARDGVAREVREEQREPVQLAEVGDAARDRREELAVVAAVDDEADAAELASGLARQRGAGAAATLDEPAPHQLVVHLDDRLAPDGKPPRRHVFARELRVPVLPRPDLVQQRFQDR